MNLLPGTFCACDGNSSETLTEISSKISGDFYPVIEACTAVWYNTGSRKEKTAHSEGRDLHMAIKSKFKFITLIVVFVILATLMLSGCSVNKKSSLNDCSDIKEGSIELRKETLSGSLNLDIDLCIADFSVSYGDSFCVNYSIPEKLIPEVSISGNTLSINGQNDNFSINLGIDSIDDLKKLGKNGSGSSKIELVLPENTELNTISINIDMGNACLREISCSDISAFVDMGNITLDKISCENLLAEVDMGSIEIKNVACEAVEVAVDMGSADISGDFAKISAESSMGGIIINTTRPEEDIEFNLDVDMGEAIINGRHV